MAANHATCCKYLNLISLSRHGVISKQFVVSRYVDVTHINEPCLALGNWFEMKICLNATTKEMTNIEIVNFVVNHPRSR